MAAISTPNLVVTKDLDNRELNVTYDIDFDVFDNATNLRYQHVVELIGDDTNVAGDPASSAPDDVLATLKSEIVRAGNAPEVNGNGLPRLPVDLTQDFAKSTLNEDIGNPNPDEIRIKVTLTPLLPKQTVRESNLRPGVDHLVDYTIARAQPPRRSAHGTDRRAATRVARPPVTSSPAFVRHDQTPRARSHLLGIARPRRDLARRPGNREHGLDACSIPEKGTRPAPPRRRWADVAHTLTVTSAPLPNPLSGKLASHDAHGRIQLRLTALRHPITFHQASRNSQAGTAAPGSRVAAGAGVSVERCQTVGTDEMRASSPGRPPAIAMRETEQSRCGGVYPPRASGAVMQPSRDHGWLGLTRGGDGGPSPGQGRPDRLAANRPMPPHQLVTGDELGGPGCVARGVLRGSVRRATGRSRDD